MSAELTLLQRAELLIVGIEALGLDVAAELGRLESLSAGQRPLAVQELQLAGLGAAGRDQGVRR